MAKILVIDLGTTYFKFALFDRGGQLCHLACREPPIRRPEAGRMELEAADFAAVLAKGIAEVANAAGGLADVDAVSFSTQTNSFLLVGPDDAPLTPILLWPDLRAAEIEAEIREYSAIPGFRAVTGVPALSAQFMIAKLVWLRRHVPQAWERAAKLCLVSDYLGLLMTGRHVTEAGAAGLTALVDIRRCRWWRELTARLEIADHWLPTVVRAGTDLGTLRPEAADRYGLPRACRFIVGCLDQYAAAISADNVAPGATSESTGTVLATISCADRLSDSLRPEVFQGPAYADRCCYRMVFGDVSAGYLEWYRNLLPDRPDFEALVALAEPIEPGAEGLRLDASVPRTTPDRVFRRWTPRHTRGHAVRCILEAVAWELRKQVLWLSEGTLPAEVRSAGGGARSDLWLAIKADVLGVPVAAVECPEPASLGAAILAESSLSGASVPQVARQWVRLRNPHRPNPERHRRYEAQSRDTRP
jgi:xylulokinase